jgi:hypothetical protein
MRSLALRFGGSKAPDLTDDMALPHPNLLLQPSAVTSLKRLTGEKIVAKLFAMQIPRQSVPPVIFTWGKLLLSTSPYRRHCWSMSCRVGAAVHMRL